MSSPDIERDKHYEALVRVEESTFFQRVDISMYIFYNNFANAWIQSIAEV